MGPGCGVWYLSLPLFLLSPCVPSFPPLCPIVSIFSSLLPSVHPHLSLSISHPPLPFFSPLAAIITSFTALYVQSATPDSTVPLKVESDHRRRGNKGPCGCAIHQPSISHPTASLETITLGRWTLRTHQTQCSEQSSRQTL